MRKKLDNRIRTMIENGVITGHRSLVVIVGDHGRDQVVILHHMLSKAAVKARPSVLWCYKKELGFSSHRKKRMRQLQKKIKSGKLDVKEDDPFELFIAATNIRYTYYSETHKILGNTYGMCVLQDFEALSPNLLARTVETVEGGGMIVLLLRGVDSLRQLYTMSMDVHARYRTEAHQDVICRFNERFILSLSTCSTCMALDDQLNILPISTHMLSIQTLPPKPVDGPLSESEEELKSLKDSLKDTQPVGVIVECCKTLDQAQAVLKFIEAISEKTLRSTVTMTAARGRGKSAALGLAMASAVAFGYSNIFVTAPSPENLKTMFEFIFKGFDALEYQEHLDYEIVQSTNPEFNKAIVRVNVFREHRQTIQYIHPSDHQKLGQAELVCIDEAAAIPLPLVRQLLGPYLVFMCSTINGYEGTGRSLSLKLINQLRQQNSTFGMGNQQSKSDKKESVASASATGRVLHEVTLQESIRYAAGDPVESWLYELLCLDASTSAMRVGSGCPVPDSCDLYYVNRDTLFSFHRASEGFLQRLMSLYVSSHYKNTPNDLQMLSDAPAHHVFVLLGPVDQASSSLPEILCVLQVCLEGDISKQTIMNSLNRGKRASGDLIPWTVSQQYQDSNFGELSGARVVRIATHPDYQGMGYGSRAVGLLEKYYQGQIPSMVEVDNQPLQEAANVEKQEVNLLAEKLMPRRNMPPLLLQLSERPAERLDYLGVSYGLTSELLRFWKKSKFTPVYLRQTTNDLTGEHSCIMLKRLTEADDEEVDEEDDEEEVENKESWLDAYWEDFRRRFVSLLSYQFKAFSPALALSVLQRKGQKSKKRPLSALELENEMSKYDLKRLELYSQNMVDYHLVMDLMPCTARLFFTGRIDVHLSIAQQAILLGIGLQHKSIDDLEKEIELPASQILGLFNRSMRKIVQFLCSIQEAAIQSTMTPQKAVVMEPVRQSLHDELVEAADEAAAQRKHHDLQVLKDIDLSKYAIKGSEQQWGDELKSSQGAISIKNSKFDKKRKTESKNGPQSKQKKFKKHKGGKK